MKTNVMRKSVLEDNCEQARPSVFDGEKAVRARAEIKIRRGKKLVVAGFVVVAIGIVLYCAVCFTAGISQEFGATLLGHTWPLGATLAVIGGGTLLWLVGSFMYLSGAMDSDTETSF